MVACMLEIVLNFSDGTGWQSDVVVQGKELHSTSVIVVL